MQMMSLTELINKFRQEKEENVKKTEQHLTEIKSAPNNTVQMPQVKKQAPTINTAPTIPPKKGGCGCWGNK